LDTTDGNQFPGLIPLSSPATRTGVEAVKPLPAFDRPKPRDGAIKSIISTGSQVILASQKMNNNSLEKFAKVRWPNY
jgi:hypothetical protein